MAFWLFQNIYYKHGWIIHPMRKTYVAVVILMIWAISSSMFAIYSYHQLKELKEALSEEIIEVNLGVKFWNGTIRWFNGTKVQAGSTLLDLTMEVAEVNYTIYPGMGAFVESIFGLKNKHPFYWMWWMWTDWGGWQEGPVAADKYVVSDKEVLLWYYEDTSISPLPKP
ncbi:MAG: hypothetical protein DRN29_09615 [Thermoplasmata archaeon]|nr:MAG: hypothetical protein DRN29_09615 [Thermoplasmata archaeon]